VCWSRSPHILIVVEVELVNLSHCGSSVTVLSATIASWMQMKKSVFGIYICNIQKSVEQITRVIKEGFKMIYLLFAMWLLWVLPWMS